MFREMLLAQTKMFLRIPKNIAPLMANSTPVSSFLVLLTVSFPRCLWRGTCILQRVLAFWIPLMYLPAVSQ